MDEQGGTATEDNKQNDMAGGPLRTCSSGPWWPDGERDVRVV